MKIKFLLHVVLAIPTLTACHKLTFEDKVAQDVEHFNRKEAPKRQDPFTVFDSMAYDRETKTISYYFTADSLGEDLFPTEQMRENTLNNIRNSIQLKPHKEHRMNFQYKYYGRRSGKVLMDAFFTPEDYN